MADDSDDTERTEDPTPKRLEEAISRGDVARSIEVNTWFMIAAGTLCVMIFAGPASVSLTVMMRGLIENSWQIHTDGLALIQLTKIVALTIAAIFGVPALLLAIAAFAGNVVQHRIVLSFESITPQLSRISPATGFGRIFSRQALVNFGKGVVKLALVGGPMAALLWPQRHRLMNLVVTDPASILPFARSLMLQMLGTVVAILAVVAVADYLFQYREWFDRHKMSLREMKEEFRQTEGDPQIKGKLKQLRNARARKRMMAAVPKASVVITNPTHFAVALQYERGMSAPICVAKGADLIARKIREVAEANEVPVVENPPLARALHATVEIDQEIPQEHYRAVAEIIGYIMRLRRAII